MKLNSNYSSLDNQGGCTQVGLGWVCAQPIINPIRLGGELPNPQPTLKGIRLVSSGKDSGGCRFQVKSKITEKDEGVMRSCQIRQDLTKSSGKLA